MQKGAFEEGNQWRFSEDCQPARRMTAKQTLKAIDNLICMSAEEVQELLGNTEAPLFLRTAARKITEGELTYVCQLRQMYNQSL